MDPMSPIAGVTLEKYAELCVAMMKTGDDVAAQVAIAAEHGVDEASWNQAKDGWTARMQDPANQGRVAHAFAPLYQAAQAAQRGGAEPLSLEQYTRIVAEYSYEKDDQGNQIETAIVLARYGYDNTSWGEVTGYWTPKVNDPADPAATRFRELMQAETDRIFGIDRSAEDDEEDEAVEVQQPHQPSADGGVVSMLMGLVNRVIG